MLERQVINDFGEWIDFTSGGIFAAILGADWRPKFHCPMVSCYGAHYRNRTTDQYIEMLKEFTGYESVALFSTGSEATEAFWRMMRVYSGKPGVWGGLINPDEVGTDHPLADAMHGMTLGALIMAGKMSWPELGYFKELGADRFGLGHEATGCMIMEPYHAASAQFHRIDPTINRIKALHDKFPDIPLCLDEVQGGFGRTGKLFGYEWYDGLKPDFVCVGKAMGGGLPLSALLGPRDIMESPVVIENAHLHSTHSGNPMMCAAGLEVIEAILEKHLIAESNRKGLFLADLLKDCGVRVHSGKGLLAGLEFEGPVEADKVVEACRAKNLLVVSTGRKWVKLGPPYTISDAELQAGVEVLKEVIAEVLNETHRDSGEEPGA